RLLMIGRSENLGLEFCRRISITNRQGWTFLQPASRVQSRRVPFERVLGAPVHTNRQRTKSCLSSSERSSPARSLSERRGLLDQIAIAENPVHDGAGHLPAKSRVINFLRLRRMRHETAFDQHRRHFSQSQNFKARSLYAAVFQAEISG